MLPSFLLPAIAVAAPPLVVAVDEAEPGLRAWWRPGELVVAPKEGDPRSALRPLAGAVPTVLPADHAEWIDLLSDCVERAPTAAMPLGSETASASLEVSETNILIRIRVGERTVAEGALGRPAAPCSLHLGQADSLSGYELMLGWKTPSGVRGLTVFRVPETALDPMEASSAEPTGPDKGGLLP